jgi:Domain of Unknown Function (DUF1080)
MGSLWLFCKKLVLICTFFLVGGSWYSEVQAQSASLRLTWTDTSDNEDGFKVERLVAGLVNATLTVPANATSYIDSALGAGTYCYQVKAFNSVGDSNPSNQACITVANSTASAGTSSNGNGDSTGSTSPTTTTNTSGNTASLRLTWTDTSDNEDGFKIERLVGGLVAATLTTAANATSYIDSALIAGTVYCYQVEAFNSVGDSNPSNQSCATAQDPIVSAGTSSNGNGDSTGSTSPTTTTNTPGNTASLRLTWTDTSDNEDGFKIERLVGGLVAATLTAAANATSYIDSALVAGTVYCYRVEAFNSVGDSNPSNQSCATAQATSVATAVSAPTPTVSPTSSTIPVSASTSTPIVLANAIGIGNGSDATSLSQMPKEWTDYDLKMNLRSMSNNSIGVMFRYQDDRNYYRFVWNQKSGFRRLEKVENGTPTVLAKDAVRYVKGRTYQAQIIARGTSLTVFIDSAQIFSVVDSTFAQGTIGLYSSTNQSSFDNIVVQDLNTGTVLLSDDFDEGTFTGWTIVDQGKNNGPSVWSATTGSLVQTSSINGTFALYTLRIWKDYRLTLKMQSQDRDSIGVMFRYQDNDNYYRFSWNRRSNFRRLEKRQNGVFTMLAEDMKTYVTGQTYPLEIVAAGANLGVTIDGTSIFSVVDSSFNAGTIALYSNFNQGSSFDDVLVQDLATGATLLSHDFNDGAFNGWTIVDQGTDQTPSAWSVKNGSFMQSSNIGSNGTGNLGTYALY